MPESRQEKGTPVVRLILAWSLVGLPLLWGVSQTVIKAMALFQ